MSDNQYDKDRNIMELDRLGNYYCRHTSALTRENLIGKSEIAAELGYRDLVIDRLQIKLDAANAEISRQALEYAMRGSIGKSNPNIVSGKW